MMAALLSAAAPWLLAAQTSPTLLAPPLIEQTTQPRPEERPGQQKPPPTSGRVAVQAGDDSTVIRAIDFVGVKAPERVAKAAQAYLGKPASGDNLKALAEAVSKAYGKSGIALYTVAIPQQDLSNGRVKLLLAEGFVEDIVYPKGASPLIRA